MFMQKRAFWNLAAALDTAERQFFDGTANDADGFVGLKEDANFDALADPRVIDGGAGADVSDIWVIRTSEDDLSLIGNGDDPLDFGDGEIHITTLTDVNNKPYTGYTAPLMSWLGLQVGSLNSIVRVANVDVDGTNIEEKTQEAISMFPGRSPATHVIMSRAARFGIQKTRTSFNGAGTPALIPANVDGVPIVISEAITTGAALV